MKKILVTGSSGLVGSEAVEFFCKKKFHVIGIDNNYRKKLFGISGDTRLNCLKLKKKFKNFTHINKDIRKYNDLKNIFKKNKFYAIIHAAAQPSHDWAASKPFVDFSINAVGTLNLLELTRQFNSKSIFVYVSTNKVYGDTPNKIRLIEKKT